MLAPKNFFALQKFFIQKNLGPKKFVKKKFLVQNNVRTKEICPIIKDNKNKGPKKFKNKKMWSTKIKLPKLIPKFFVNKTQVASVQLGKTLDLNL